MKWRRRKIEDNLTEYVSGKYVLIPCPYYAGHAERPKVKGWDIKYGDRYLRYNSEEREESSSFAYTVRTLADAKLVAEKHTALREAIARPRRSRAEVLEAARAKVVRKGEEPEPHKIVS